jgi:hypothetical protein
MKIHFVKQTWFVAVLVAAGALGVWSELYGQASVSKSTAQNLSVSAPGMDANITDNGDGTAWVSVSVSANGGTGWVQGAGVVTDFHLNVTKRGQSGPPGSGEGSAILDGENIDFDTWTSTPVVIGVDAAVTPDGINEQTNSFSNHNTQYWNNTAVRVHQVGSQTWDAEGGSLSITVDGVPFAAGNGSGYVEKYSTHSITMP